LAEQDGSAVDFNADIVGADVIVMIATTDEGAAAAGVIGAMARARGVMTAGIVMAGARDGDTVMGAMRPCTAVLVRAGDEDYLPAMLSALRA
jgi:urease gamma subunit